MHIFRLFRNNHDLISKNSINRFFIVAIFFCQCQHPTTSPIEDLKTEITPDVIKINFEKKIIKYKNDSFNISLPTYITINDDNHLESTKNKTSPSIYIEKNKTELNTFNYKIYNHGILDDRTYKTSKKTIQFPNSIFFKKNVSAHKNFLSDKNSMIAHAGGEIDGKKYTNSLEALNYSYSKGFRNFELDIIKTKDNKYVAAHDWKTWNNHTNTDFIPTAKEFKTYKIHNKYTPLTIEEINTWFANHTDAILVTDKINDPEKMVSIFQFKNRLKMELFTIQSFRKAQSLNILEPILSESVFNYVPKEKRIKFLIEENVKTVALSINIVENDIEFFQKNKNFKTYVFHINFKEGKDEIYASFMYNHILKGIYADIYPSI